MSDGYSLDAVRGYTLDVETEYEPVNIATVLGQVDARLTRSVAGLLTVLGVLGTVETATLSPLPVALALAAVVFAAGEVTVPDSVVKYHKVRRPGMTEREVYRRLTMSNEINELKEEEREKARRKAKRKRSTGFK